MWEQEYPVLPLGEAEAIDLFQARARAVAPDFAANGGVAEICRRLDHLPLAVELAAARVRALSVDEILAHLEQRLPFLVSGARDVPDRQRTLRGTIAWSYELLPTEEQASFARLGVFTGGFSLESASVVAEAGVDRVQSLVEKSLLRHSDGRYFMLETIREYALERLGETGEEASCRDRHAHYFAARADCRWWELMRGDTEFRALVTAERRNFAAALEWSLEREHGEDALALVSGLWSSWSDPRQGRRILERALALPAEQATARRAHALVARADTSRALGDLDVSRRAFEDALDVHRQHDLGPSFLSMCILGLADVALAQGDLVAARRHAEESARIRRDELESAYIGRALFTLAEIELVEGDLDRTRELLEEAVERQRIDGPDSAFLVGFLSRLGEVKRRQGDTEGALGSLTESLVLGLALAAHGLERILLDPLGGMGRMFTELGHVERAARLAGAVERYREASGSGTAESDAVDRRLGRLPDPREWGIDPDSKDWVAGRGMSLAEAAEYALASID
jgi:tetratricopeptide (TPR) repeat protein